MTLKEWLSANGMSHRRFARELGTSQQNVSSWVGGRSLPRVQFAVQIEKMTEGQVPVVVWVNKEVINE